MRAVFAESQNFDDPLAGLRVADVPAPVVEPGWTVVQVKAASLNHHDLWSLRGIGLEPERLPMVLGCDAAGLDANGNPVVVYPIVTDDPNAVDETLGRDRSILSERYPGTFADQVAVPSRNLLPLPAGWSMAEAACLPTAWLTAYRMLATRSGLQPGHTVLIQGAGGGVATALIALAGVMGLRVWVTSRDESKRQQALKLGAHEVFASGARLPERVDAVMETVGAATWAHSIKVLKPGGTVVISGATTGAQPPAELARIFFLQLSVVGSTMGTRAELEQLISLCTTTGLRPVIEQKYPAADAPAAFGHLLAGNVFGKLVLEF